MSDRYVYRYCGLVVRSTLALPELPALANTGPADVELREAAVPLHLPNPLRRTATFDTTEDSAIFRLEGIARYRVAEGGRLIEVDIAPRADAAAAVDGRAVAFVGPSAAGKSTAAGLLARDGHPTMSDSLPRVTIAPVGAVARPSAGPLAAAVAGYRRAVGAGGIGRTGPSPSVVAARAVADRGRCAAVDTARGVARATRKRSRPLQGRDEAGRSRLRSPVVLHVRQCLAAGRPPANGCTISAGEACISVHSSYNSRAHVSATWSTALVQGDARAWVGRRNPLQHGPKATIIENGQCL